MTVFTDAAGEAPEPLRIMKFVATFGCGGTERQFVRLSLALDPSRFELMFGCLKRWGPFLENIQNKGILLREYRLASFRSVRAVREQFRLAAHIARRSITIVHAYNFYANVFAVPAAYLAGAPVIIASIRDKGAYLTAPQKWFQRQVCRLADCVLVNADSIRDWLIKDGYDPARIVNIPNGLELSQFEDARRAETRASLGVSENARLVVMLSRITRVKGIEDFIDAAAMIAASHPDVQFLVVGAGHILQRGVMADDVYADELQERARQRGLAGRLKFTGYREDVPQILAETSVSVLPSLTEGLSNAILESMAAGVPMVATRVGGTPELIEDGVTGVLVPPREPQTLAAAIARVLDDGALAARLGQAGQRSVAERYSAERMVQSTVELYERLVREKANANAARRARWMEAPRRLLLGKR
jgi:glycosyltransferase involved in cell wall biosynthesis